MNSSPSTSSATETAVFAAGCFWGVEETFRVMEGVVSTQVGYSGGDTENPTYEQVCTDQTGHAEAVKIVFDPQKITYTKLLKTFFENHNPTCMNYQGPDFGSQYRSAIFFMTPKQQEEAEAEKIAQDQSGVWGKPVVTQIVPLQTFYPAEAYHQQYLMKRGLGSCHL